MVVSADEIARRQAAAPPSAPCIAESGYRRLYLEHVTQADRGCDFDFMLPAMLLRAPVGG
jgi:dihydroxy-acid dehydratase